MRAEDIHRKISLLKIIIDGETTDHISLFSIVELTNCDKKL